MNKVSSFFVAGLKFGQHKQIPGLKSGEQVFLRNNPNNEYDPNAIELLIRENDHSFYKLGHVPRSETYLLHAYRLKNIPLRATLFSYNPSFPNEKAALVSVEAETKLEITDEEQFEFVNL